jgi:D-glycero-alpha-D-manno-heptose-7-phosphate kinase
MRISLAGGGTDVPPLARGIGGRVVCTAIDLHVRAIVEPFDRGWVRLEGSWGAADAPPDEVAPVPSLRAATLTRRVAEAPSTDVAFRLLEAVRALAGVDDGVHIRVESDLTPGTGLGGSAAAAVALLAAFDRALGRPADANRLAIEASSLERDVLGLRCGLQDQLASAAGGLLDLRFFDDGFRVAPIVASPALVRDLTAGLLLVDTRVRRVSGEILDVANDGCELDLPADLVAAADDTARGFRLGSLPLVVAGMRRSASAKLRRGGPSALPWDWVRRLSRLGAVVVRSCGAGGGGHVLVWAEPSCHAALARAVAPCVVRRPALGVPGVTSSLLPA